MRQTTELGYWWCPEGHQTEDRYNFCPHHGTPRQSPIPRPPSRRGNRWGLILALSCIAAVIYGLIAYSTFV